MMTECRRYCAGFLCGLLVALSGSAPAAAPSPTLSAAQGAWAEADITPPLGIGLGGRGGPETLADKVLDPLSAELLYLKDAKGTGFVLVSFDLVGLPHSLSDQLRTDIAQELGVPWNLIVLNASHTHSGPYVLRELMAGVGPAPQVERDYFHTLEDKVIGLARRAARSLQPVEVRVFQGTSQLGINRRGRDEQGRFGIFPNPQAPFDDQVWVLQVSPTNGQPPAVVFSYACHPVIVYGFARTAISADFPGVARRELRAALGTHTHAQFVQGFAGNIRPRVLADLENHLFRPSRPDDVEGAGKELAGAVLGALKGHGESLALDIAGAEDHPFLPRGNPPPRALYEQMRASALSTNDPFHLAVSEYWLARYDSGQPFAQGDTWSLGLVRLAPNQWVVHSGGEPCVEWRGKLAHWLAPLEVVPWGYCQESRSYLPTEGLLPEGGYEVLQSNEARRSTPAPFAPGIEAAVRESLLRQWAFIQAPGR